MKPHGYDARPELEQRAQRVLDRDAKFGLVVVMDEHGTIDFGHEVTTNQIRDALLAYARDIAAYPGD